MNTISRKTATKEQLEEMERHIHVYMNILGECLEDTELLGLNVADELRTILGLGVKSGALAKYENMSKIINDEISFEVWVKVGEYNPPLYTKVKTILNLATKHAQILEDENNP